MCDFCVGEREWSIYWSVVVWWVNVVGYLWRLFVGELWMCIDGWFGRGKIVDVGRWLLFVWLGNGFLFWSWGGWRYIFLCD